MDDFATLADAMDADLLEAFGAKADYRAGGIAAPVRTSAVLETQTADALSLGSRLRRAVRFVTFSRAAAPTPRKGDTFTFIETGEMVQLANTPDHIAGDGGLWRGEAQ